MIIQVNHVYNTTDKAMISIKNLILHKEITVI